MSGKRMKELRKKSGYKGNKRFIVVKDISKDRGVFLRKVRADEAGIVYTQLKTRGV